MDMPEADNSIACCESCGGAMDVSSLAPFSRVLCPACGKEVRVKLNFGPYVLVRRHAIGGMSMVFIAHDPTLDREVALKILSEEFSADERRINAFEEEARITASFSHPHVVRVLTTGKAFGRLYIAMELVPGGHFEHQIRERGKIPEVEMLPLAIEVAQGLKAAHAAGLIHRDIKPGNILLDAEGHAKIVDFGLALVTQGGKAQATEIWATPYYVPPETIEGNPEDFRSDIYAFGATLYHALSGAPSCGEETMVTDLLREAKRKVVPLGVAAPWLTEETCRIVERAMAYDPGDRFQSYDETIRRLEGALSRLKSGAPGGLETSGSAAKRRARKKQSERLLMAGAVVALMVVAVALLFFVMRKQASPGEKGIVAERSMILPDAFNNASATDVLKNYREARAAVQGGDFSKGVELFVKLRKNPEVQEPTRSWAGVEAVVAAFLNGNADEAKTIAEETADHASSVDDSRRLHHDLIILLNKLAIFEPFSPGQLGTVDVDAPHVMAWFLAGLKDWEQGMLPEGAACFQAVASAKLAGDDEWLSLYQKIARDYLNDYEKLSGNLFHQLPSDVASCEKAIGQLDLLLKTLKTRGRSRFNVRAWQLDLKRHASLLAAPPLKSSPVEVATSAEIGLDAVMAKILEFSGVCDFAGATGYLRSLSSASDTVDLVSLISLTEAATIFLVDLQEDLMRNELTADLLMKSGETVKKTSASADGLLSVTDEAGKIRTVVWSDFSPESLIEMHRVFVRNPNSELERLRRHECAISYGWLAGDRERALSAAAFLSHENASFKVRWESIAKAFPK
jgi:tRNA A-37 threonylcarbamoyl transferase component Bud32